MEKEIKLEKQEINIEETINKAVKETIKQYDKEKLMAQRDRRFHNTKLLMRNYTKLKHHIDDVSDKLEINADNEEDEIWIISIARTKLRTMKMMAYIDSALLILENNFKNQCQEYKYKAFKLYYMEGLKNEQIQEQLRCGKNSPKTWSDEVTNELSILLWGIEALGM